MALKYQKPKYTHDAYPGAANWEEDSERYNHLEADFRALCRAYGYGEVRTPLFESTDLFTRSIGEGTDIVNKEMYTFTTRGGDSVTLRPESTAPVLRAYIENGLHAQAALTKLYYIALHFRYERGQKGRYRQHEQFGVEALGSDDPALDAEVIQLALAFFKRIGIERLTLKLNSVGSSESRARYVTALRDFVAPYLPEFSEEGKARYENNPLRMLDTKAPHELEILRRAPQLMNYLTDEEAQHFATVRGYLDAVSVTYELDPHLVRGFDYYTKTAFEIQSPDLGAQNALGGGGRYNKLVEEIGGPPTPGIGFGLGVERVLIALQSLGAEMAFPPAPMAFIVTIGDAARPVGVALLSRLRSAGITATIEYGTHSLKAQLRAANKSRCRYALIIGEDEVAQNVVQFKNLADSWQLTVPLAEAVEWLEGNPPRGG
ncbi:MAG: histidine--tRNA ligase [Armatimonadota bacterium]|nr:histidine--tRNA ligase [Armatimonadota bacterium]